MTRHWKAITVALLLGALAIAASFRFLQERHGRIPAGSLVRHTAVVDADKIAVQQAAIMAAAGQNAVAYIDAARDRLQSDRIPQAKRFLIQADAILVQIRTALQVDGRNAGSGAELRVPLWAQVDLVGEQAPLEALQSHLQEVSTHAIQGEHDRAIERLAGTGVGATYSYIDMPLGATLARIEAALRAVNDGDAAEALAMLNAAADGLSSETLVVGAANEPPEATTEK